MFNSMFDLLFLYSYGFLYLKYPQEINDEKYKFVCYELLEMIADELAIKNMTLFFNELWK